MSGERPSISAFQQPEGSTEECLWRLLPMEIILQIIDQVKRSADKRALSMVNKFFYQTMNEDYYLQHVNANLTNNIKHAASFIQGVDLGSRQDNIFNFVLSDHTLVICRKNQIVGFSLRTNKQLWTYDVENAQGVWMDQSMAIVASQRTDKFKKIDFINMQTGTILHTLKRIESAENNYFRLIKSHDKMIALQHDGQVICWDIKTKKIKENYLCHVTPEKNPILHATQSHIVIVESEKITLINRQSNRINTVTAKSLAPEESPAHVKITASLLSSRKPDNKLILALSKDCAQDSIVILDLSDQRKNTCYSLAMEEEVSSIAANADWVVVATSSGEVKAVSNDGETIASPYHLKNNGKYVLYLPHEYPHYLFIQYQDYSTSPRRNKPSTHISIIDVRTMKEVGYIPYKNPSNALFANNLVLFVSGNQLLMSDLGETTVPYPLQTALLPK